MHYIRLILWLTSSKKGNCRTAVREVDGNNAASDEIVQSSWGGCKLHLSGKFTTKHPLSRLCANIVEERPPFF